MQDSRFGAGAQPGRVFVEFCWPGGTKLICLSSETSNAYGRHGDTAMMQPIQMGQVYWVELEGVRLKLRAIARVPRLKGWWRCAALLGGELILPDAAFREPYRENDRTSSHPENQLAAADR